MAILGPELKLYKSAVVNDGSTNGGRLSANEVVDGVKNNVFPSITDAERLAGVERYRKIGFQIENDADLTGSNAHFCLDQITPGGGLVTLFQTANVLRDTQADILGTERQYGVGELNADITAGATSLVVNAESGAGAKLIFQAGDTLYLTDGTNKEYVTIDTGGVSWTGDQATITLAAGTVYGYAAATPTVVASCIDQATVACSVDNWAETSTSGTYDETTYPVETDNIGTVEETWTLTFSDATNFSVSGDTKGSVGSGTTGGDFAPSNPDKSKPYFTLRAAGFAGSWANGETIVFQTHMAAVLAWADQDTPAGTGSYANDGTSFNFSIESA